MTPIKQPGRAPSIVFWILIVGGLGFAAGFFGPIAFNPEANQGPLLGIFISGPAGAFLGLFFWAVCRLLKISAARQWPILWSMSAILAVVTLYFCLPGPKLRGDIVEVQVLACESPAQKSDAAIAYWEKRVREVTWSPPRPGWQNEARSDLQSDPGVVLDTRILRKKLIYENRKPWNDETIFATVWQATDETKSYYLRSCGDYSAGMKLVEFVPSDISALDAKITVWPPKHVPALLDLAKAEPVSADYQKFLAD